MRRGALRLALAAFGLALAVGSAGAEEAPKYGGTLTYLIPADAPPTFDAQREPLRCPRDTLRHQSVEICSVAELARGSEQRVLRLQRRAIESAARLGELLPGRRRLRWCGGLGNLAGRLRTRSDDWRRAARRHTLPFSALFTALTRDKTSAGHNEGREL